MVRVPGMAALPRVPYVLPPGLDLLIVVEP